MSVPGLKPAAPPAQAPAPIPPQILPPRPELPRLLNRPAVQGETGHEYTASERGLKRGRSAEDQCMDVETSSEPVLKRRRGEEEVPTPERLEVLVEEKDPRDALIREHQAVLDALCATPSLSGANPLIYAASHGFESVVRTFVESSNYKDVNIALVHAVKSGHLNIAKLLHSGGANLDIKDASGKCCLHFAIESDDSEMLAWLLDGGAVVDSSTTFGVTPLMQACARGNKEILRLLQAHHANFDATDAAGRSCLHYAVESGHLAVMEWLIELGADVNVSADSGLTPLMQACGKGNLDAASLLQAHDADFAAEDDHGRNCMYYAAAHGQQRVVDWLLAQGAPADEPDSQGRTPIFSAFSKRHWPCVNSLLAAKVKIVAEVEILGAHPAGYLFCYDIRDEAIKDGQYQVLLSLYKRKLERLNLEARDLGFDDDSMLSFSGGLDVFFAEFRDLIRIVESLKKSNTATGLGGISKSKKAQREVFVSEYVDDIKRGPVISSDSENFEVIPILDSYYIEHPLFSYVVHHRLIPDHTKWIQLTEALAGKKNDVFDKQMQSILLHKMRMLKASSGLAHVFSGKHLSPKLERKLKAKLLQKLNGMILAFKESLVVESADFEAHFTALCQTRMSGDFHAPSFKKALSKRLGFYSVNADRLTGLVGQAWEVVRRKPLDLPPIVSVDQAVHLVSKYSVEKMLDELKKSLIQSAKAHKLPAESDNLERLTSEEEEDDTYPGLSAQLKAPLSDPPDPLIMPGFTEGLDGLEQEEQDLYADLIFDQWRQINAALGVVVPEPFAAQQ